MKSTKVTIENTGLCVEDDSVYMLRNNSRDGEITGPRLSTDQRGLITGQNSGYQVIDLVQQLGANPVVLLGYSMKPLADGRMHWFGDHPAKTSAAIFSAMLQQFNRLAPAAKRRGLAILNATRDTALTCFERVDLARLVADS